MSASFNESTRLKVLIVDDSALTRAMIRRSVEMSGLAATLEEAPNGRLALARLAEGGIDLCFLDLNMPEMGGIEVAKAVRDDERYAGVRVVVVSSESMANRIQELQAAGVKAYIRKPFTPEQIRDIVQRVHCEAVPSETAAA
jgi:two-component system chemotaxis response regulator CheY